MKAKRMRPWTSLLRALDGTLANEVAEDEKIQSSVVAGTTEGASPDAPQTLKYTYIVGIGSMGKEGFRKRNLRQEQLQAELEYEIDARLRLLKGAIRFGGGL